ncbi:MAG: TMEM165/GDT1 family protein [Anaerolineae bacterium]|nr:TMEM165/GDT1 family protein [Anaerolineae bacterium]
MDWSALFSTLGLVFVAELGDKTQLAVITQTCKFRRPWAVFGGASLALTLVTLVGAIGGQALNRFIPAEALQIAAALAFVVMGILIAREAIKSAKTGEQACKHIGADPECANSDLSWKAFGSTLSLLFVAELGDKTQLAVLSLASKAGSPWLVFAGGSLALILVTAIGVIGGQGLCQLIPERILLWISAIAFIVMGILMEFGVL